MKNAIVNVNHFTAENFDLLNDLFTMKRLSPQVYHKVARANPKGDKWLEYVYSDHIKGIDSDVSDINRIEQ